jgi:hypothetical protein
VKRVALMVLLAGSTAWAQDSSFSVLRARVGVLRLPVIGHISDDWSPKTGGQLDVASNVGSNEIALSIGRVGFDPTTGKPPFTETLISLAWARPIARRGPVAVEMGVRLTDVRMNFDDPAMVAGLRNEEEQLLSGLGRLRLSLGGRYSGFIESTYGLLMTSTRSPTATLAAGLQGQGRMPGWLRAFLE